MAGDSIDYSDGQLLIGCYAAKNQIQVWDLNKFTQRESISWNSAQDTEKVAYVYTAGFGYFSLTQTQGQKVDSGWSMWSERGEDLSLVGWNLPTDDSGAQYRSRLFFYRLQFHHKRILLYHGSRRLLHLQGGQGAMIISHKQLEGWGKHINCCWGDISCEQVISEVYLRQISS